MAGSSLQDIICCIGHPVFANPTQYVMECALTAAGLDFRCLTLDVDPEALQPAIHGLRAMGFCGAVVAAPHETHVRPYLDAMRGVVAGHDYVDLIYRDDDQLVGEATLGAAVWMLVQRLFSSAASATPSQDKAVHSLGVPSSALVLGDDARAIAIARTLSAAGMATTAVATAPAGPEESRGAKTDELFAPRTDVDDGSSGRDGGDEVTDDRVDASDPSETTLNSTISSQEIIENPTDADRVETLEGPEQAIRHLTLEELEIGQVGAELVVQAAASLTHPPIALPRPDLSNVVVDLTTETVRTDFLSAAEAAGCATVNSVNVQLQMLIMAFQRWTGVDPDEQIMRDALEEFLLV